MVALYQMFNDAPLSPCHFKIVSMFLSTLYPYLLGPLCPNVMYKSYGCVTKFNYVTASPCHADNVAMCEMDPLSISYYNCLIIPLAFRKKKT